MRVENLNEMVKGWFVGAFSPSVYDTDQVEVGIKRYKQGDHEDKHYHKIATEITVVISGKIRMCEREFTQDDIIVLSPGEATEFTALTDSVCAVVKTPGALNDKYVV